MDVDRCRRTTAGLLAAAALTLTGCSPGPAVEGTDIQAPGPHGGTGGVPASAQLPPPPPTRPA
ncbi:hypothetical protein SAMN05661080_02647 [Modestobacter sp. DSM 44400]|nr:hypothetical protein SAMN05661080_02647 [Modestobacter sp. DSM 44400]